MHVKKLQLYQVHRQQIRVLLYTVFGILRFGNLLEGLTGPGNVVTLTVKVSYSTRIQIKISKGKGCTGWVESRHTGPAASFQFSTRAVTQRELSSLSNDV